LKYVEPLTSFEAQKTNIGFVMSVYPCLSVRIE